MQRGAIFAPLGRFRVPFWHLLDFEGPIRLVCLNIFGTTATNRTIMICLTNVPLKLESANNEQHRRNEGPIHLAFPHDLALFESAQWGWGD